MTRRKRYASDAMPAPARTKGEERALELARKQVPDERIRAVLTTEKLGTRAQNAKLVDSMAADLADARETGLANMQERMWDDAERSNDGKSWRALEWLSQQYLGHRAGGQAEEIRKLLDEFRRLKPEERVAKLDEVREELRGPRAA